MNTTLKSLLYVPFAVGLLFVTSCSKSSELGLSLVEQSQSEIITSDTVSMVLTTIEAQATETSNRSLMVCGAYSDMMSAAEWGDVEASFYLNFRLPITAVTFPNSVFDSLVLTFAYENFGHYGELLINKPTQATQSWEVLRLTEDILESELYTSDVSFATGDYLKTGFEFNPNDTLVLTLNGVETVPHIRIKLDDAAALALGQTLLQPQGADTAIYESNSNFKDWFKGVQVRPTPGYNNNTIIRLLSKDPMTKLTLYYSDTSNGGSVQNTFDFLTNEDAEIVSTFAHNHPVALTDNTASDTIVYVQGLDGLHTKIDFPYVNNLGDIIINKAELVFQVADTGTQEYPEPIIIMTKIRADNDDLGYISDVTTSLNNIGSYFLYGGVFEEINDTKTYLYRINFAEQMQAIVDGNTKESSIYLTTPSALDPERIKLINQLGSKPPVLYLTYTKVPQN
jgi:hypothetical protein